MNYLSLDIGLKRTGVAFADSETQVPLSLDTIHHDGIEELFTLVQPLVLEKNVDHVVLGLPRLLSGNEGKQCSFVREFGAYLGGNSIPYSFIDERYTSFTPGVDSDASAANQLLLTFLEQK